MYSNDSFGTVRAASEFTHHDVLDDYMVVVDRESVEMPLLAGIEALVATRHSSPVCRPTEKAAAAQEAHSDNAGDFIHRSPAKQKEGRSTEHHKHVDEITETGDAPEHVSDTPSNPTIVETTQEADLDSEDINRMLIQGSHRIDLLSDLQGRYAEDPFFKAVLEKPKEF